MTVSERTKSAVRVALIDAVGKVMDGGDFDESEFGWFGDSIYECMADAALACLLAQATTNEYRDREVEGCA